jgi:hypothetical protein
LTTLLHRQVEEVLDVAVLECSERVKTGSSRGQFVNGIQDWECWLVFLLRHEG